MNIVTEKIGIQGSCSGSSTLNDVSLKGQIHIYTFRDFVFSDQEHLALHVLLSWRYTNIFPCQVGWGYLDAEQ